MKRMAKQCKHPTCGEVCRRQPAPKKEPVAIKKVANSRKEAEKQYRQKAKKFRQEHPLCEIKSSVCTRKTQGVHHVKGRLGDLLLDEKYWKGACNACNSYVESHPVWAIENGHKISKFKPNV